MKRNMVNRILATCLCASMVASVVPTGVLEVNGQISNSQDAIGAKTITGETTLNFEQPYAKVNQPLKVVVQNGTAGETYTYAWRVGGKVKPGVTGDTYIPKEEDLEKILEVTARNSSGKYYVQTMYFSKLPVVYVETENLQPVMYKEQYLKATMKVQGNDKYSNASQLYSGVAEIKGRGNSTWSMPKKPYKLKLDKKADLFGFGKNKHWVLLANYLDPTFNRNKLAYDFSGEMGLTQMQSDNVVLMLNGEYQGVYQLCEHIRIDTDNRVDITDWEDIAEDIAKAIQKRETTLDKKVLEDALKEDLKWITTGQFHYRENGKTYKISEYYTTAIPKVDGGYILELDQYFDENSKFKSMLGQPIMVNSPEFAFSNNEMQSYLVEYIDAFENAIVSEDGYTNYKGKATHYSELFDMDALVKYWLVNELFYNQDGMKKSTYMYKGHNELMKMGPVWDMDWSSYGLQGDSQATNQWQTLSFNDGVQYNQWYKHIIRDPYFMMKAYDTYRQYREYIGTMIASGGLMDTAQQYLQEAGVANDGMWRKGKGYISETIKLKGWLTARLAWLDEQFASVDTLVSSLGMYQNNQHGMSLLNIQGIKKNADGSLTVTAITNTGDVADIKVYINGLLAGTATKDGNNQIQVTIPADKVNQNGSNMVVVREPSPWGVYTDYEVSGDAGNSQVVSKSALLVAINNAKSKVEKDYTPESYNLLKEKIASAEIVYKDSTATQTQVNTALSGIQAAIRGLIPVQSGETTELTELPTAGMSATAGSEELIEGNIKKEGAASFVLDGDETTFWHTQWKGASKENLYVDINLGANYKVGGVKILARQDTSRNGLITTAEIYKSSDGQNYEKVTTKELVDPSSKQGETITFDAVDAKYIRIKAIKSISGDKNDYASAAEIKVLGQSQGEITKSALKALIDRVESLNTGNYTLESFQKVQKAKGEAELIYNNKEATQQDITKAYNNLNQAINGLAPISNISKETLKEVIDRGRTCQASDYTPASYASLIGAIGLADLVYQKPDATPDQIKQAIVGLTASIGNLKKKADKAELKATIARAKALKKEQYTKLTYRLLEIALETAEKFYNDENAIQVDVDHRVLEVKKAIDELEVKADYSDLRTAITNAENNKEGDFTEETFTVLKKALDEAKVVLANEDASQEMVNEVMAKLNEAVDGLKKLSDSSNNNTPGWGRDNNGKYFVKDDKTKAKNEWLQTKEGWYYFKDIYCVVDWANISNTWYYFDQQGKMLTGWQTIGGTWYYLNASGAMLTGWQVVDGVWYYFNGSGAMLTGWQEIAGNWYYFNASGAMLTGWQVLNGAWYYLGNANSGKMAVGWQVIGDAWYYFNSSGVMTTGWQQAGGSWYYMNGSGVMQTGWINLGGTYYFLYENGVMAQNTWVSGKYYVNSSGVWVQTR